MRWNEAVIFLSLWRAGLVEQDEMKGISWRWQSIDERLSKSPWLRKSLVETRLAGGKKEANLIMLVDGRGVPVSLVVTEANRYDVTQLEMVLEEIVIARPEGIEQHLCADKGFDGEPASQIIISNGYLPHLKKRGEVSQEKKANSHYKA